MLRFVGRITIKFQQYKKYDKNTTTKISKVPNNTKGTIKLSYIEELAVIVKRHPNAIRQGKLIKLNE
jgi:hypothetical protein